MPRRLASRQPLDVAVPLEVGIPLVVVLAVADSVASDNERLRLDVLDTILSVQPSSNKDIISWQYRFAVRVQMALKLQGSEVAEPVGRCIDAALSSCSDGAAFKFWAQPPLPGLVSPTSTAHAEESFSRVPESLKVSLGSMSAYFHDARDPRFRLMRKLNRGACIDARMRLVCLAGPVSHARHVHADSSRTRTLCGRCFKEAQVA